MARAFADEVIRLAAEALDREERFPGEIYDEMAKLGPFGIGVPEETGGPGFDSLIHALVVEEQSRGYAGVADQCGLLKLISTLLVRHGTRSKGCCPTSSPCAAWSPIASPSRRRGPTSRVSARRRQHEAQVRDRCVVDPDLPAVRHPAAAVAYRGRTRRRATGGCRSSSSTSMPLGWSAGRRSTRWASVRARLAR